MFVLTSVAINLSDSLSSRIIFNIDCPSGNQSFRAAFSSGTSFANLLPSPNAADTVYKPAATGAALNPVAANPPSAVAIFHFSTESFPAHKFLSPCAKSDDKFFMPVKNPSLKRLSLTLNEVLPYTFCSKAALTTLLSCKSN